MIEHELTVQEKVYVLYVEDGLRIDVIAKRLGIKQSSARTFLSNQRRVMGESPKPKGFNLNNTPCKKPSGKKPKLIGYSQGSDMAEMNEWMSLGMAANKAVVSIGKRTGKGSDK